MTAITLTACSSSPPPASEPQPQPAETIVAYSTIGWTASPPFRREACGKESKEGEKPEDCFFFTTSAAARAWDLARFNAAYKLTGRWTGRRTGLRDWILDAGQQPGELDRRPESFPIFEVDSFCVIEGDAILHKAVDDAGRTWLRENNCE